MTQRQSTVCYTFTRIGLLDATRQVGEGPTLGAKHNKHPIAAD